MVLLLNVDFLADKLCLQQTMVNRFSQMALEENSHPSSVSDDPAHNTRTDFCWRSLCLDFYGQGDFLVCICTCIYNNGQFKHQTQTLITCEFSPPLCLKG